MALWTIAKPAIIEELRKMNFNKIVFVLPGTDWALN
jgi:hypothetical protein